MNPYRLYALRLSARREVSPSFVRITLRGDDLATCSDILLDQRVKLLVGSPEGLAEVGASVEDWYPAWQDIADERRPAMRTYTLVAVRPGSDGSGEVDIDVAIHPTDGAAPGMDFAATAPLGTPAALVAAEVGRDGYEDVGVAWHPGDATEVLLAGDETALPAIANIAGTLGPGIRGRIVLEVPHPEDTRTIAAPDGVVVEWWIRERGERAVGLFGGREETDVTDDGDLLWDEARGAAGWYGWIAGEAGWVRELRAEARTAGIPRGQISFMGYWKRGAVGA